MREGEEEEEEGEQEEEEEEPQTCTTTYKGTVLCDRESYFFLWMLASLLLQSTAFCCRRCGCAPPLAGRHLPRNSCREE